MAHSKRNTSLAFFTAHERAELKGHWGSRSTRLSRESFLPFGSCRLCLLPARQPVACSTKGHLFCRECAVKNLLAQGAELKRLRKERERREEEVKEQQQRQEREAEERAVEEFELVQTGLRLRTSNGEGRGDPSLRQKVIGRENGKVIIEQETADANDTSSSGAASRGTKRKFELDEAELLRLARADRESTKRRIAAEKDLADRQSALPSFWVPSQTPDEGKQKKHGNSTKPDKQHPTCPAGTATTENDTHEFSLKSLVTVHFHEDTSDDNVNRDPANRSCPSCHKPLSNATKAILARACGHVLCKACSETFQRPRLASAHDKVSTSTSSDSQAGEIRCYVCQTDLTAEARPRTKDQEKDKNQVRDKISRSGGGSCLIELATDGTGFAGAGSNMVRKEGVAFQC